MEINKENVVGIAKWRYIRSSAQKIRLVVNEIRGKNVVKALDALNFTNKRASKIVKKVLLSAMSNAKHNFSLDPINLKIMKIFVDGGPSLKRVMPRAKGRADHVVKRTSHVTVVLSDLFKEKEKKR